MKERGVEKEYIAATKFIITINIPEMQVLFLLLPSSNKTPKSYPFPHLKRQYQCMVLNK